MNTQLTIITVLVVVSAVSLVINFGLWSDLKQAQNDIKFHKEETEFAEEGAAFWEAECETYIWEATKLESAYNDCVAIIREMQEDLAFAEQSNAALADEVATLEDLLAAIHAASPITADIWYEDTFPSEPPF